MTKKRKTLPKDFEELLKQAKTDPIKIDEIKAVFDKCELNATGGYSKHTAIGFLECPDEIIIWLAEQGLDVDTSDSYQRSPLWERAYMGWIEQIPLLIQLGADIEKPDYMGTTPLEASLQRLKFPSVQLLLSMGANLKYRNAKNISPIVTALRHTQNISIPEMTKIAQLLLPKDPTITPEMQDLVKQIGERFEFYRDRFNPGSLEETDKALQELYRLFQVEPVKPRH